jgi:hypothetical protein
MGFLLYNIIKAAGVDCITEIKGRVIQVGFNENSILTKMSDFHGDFYFSHPESWEKFESSHED